MTALVTPEWINDLFVAIDDKDSRRFAGFLASDAIFRFGSADPVRGRDGARDAVDGFFASIDGLRHNLTGYWSAEGSHVCVGDVTYTRLDKSTITLPFADVFRMRGELIGEYLIYMDIAPLYST